MCPLEGSPSTTTIVVAGQTADRLVEDRNLAIVTGVTIVTSHLPHRVVKLLPHFVLLALTTVDKHVQRYVTPVMRWGTIHLAVSCRSIRI